MIEAMIDWAETSEQRVRIESEEVVEKALLAASEGRAEPPVIVRQSQRRDAAEPVR